MYRTVTYLELLLSISEWFPLKEGRNPRLGKINRNMVVGVERVDILSCRPGWAIHLFDHSQVGCSLLDVGTDTVTLTQC